MYRMWASLRSRAERETRYHYRHLRSWYQGKLESESRWHSPQTDMAGHVQNCSGQDLAIHQYEKTMSNSFCELCDDMKTSITEAKWKLRAEIGDFIPQAVGMAGSLQWHKADDTCAWNKRASPQAPKISLLENAVTNEACIVVILSALMSTSVCNKGSRYMRNEADSRV